MAVSLSAFYVDQEKKAWMHQSALWYWVVYIPFWKGKRNMSLWQDRFGFPPARWEWQRTRSKWALIVAARMKHSDYEYGVLMTMSIEFTNGQFLPPFYASLVELVRVGWPSLLQCSIYIDQKKRLNQSFTRTKEFGQPTWTYTHMGLIF